MRSFAEGPWFVRSGNGWRLSTASLSTRFGIPYNIPIVEAW